MGDPRCLLFGAEITYEDQTHSGKLVILSGRRNAVKKVEVWYDGGSSGCQDVTRLYFNGSCPLPSLQVLTSLLTTTWALYKVPDTYRKLATSG